MATILEVSAFDNSLLKRLVTSQSPELQRPENVMGMGNGCCRGVFSIGRVAPTSESGMSCPEDVATMRTATDEISVCGCYIETMFEVGTKLDGYRL